MLREAFNKKQSNLGKSPNRGGLITTELFQPLNSFLNKCWEWSETQNKHIKSITKFFIKQTVREGGVGYT